MIQFHYKGRIHKGKFTARSLRYALSDQAARLVPALQRRWLFPVEARPIAEAAYKTLVIPSVEVGEAMPALFRKLGARYSNPLQIEHHVYSMRDVTVTGWAGAMIQGGLLLAVRPKQNWVSALRAYPHSVRRLSEGRPYFNLMAPIPARAHVFHWLFDSILPLLSYLENGGAAERPGLIVNANRSVFQDRTLAFVKARYGIEAIEHVAEKEAVIVPDLRASIHVPNAPRALQAPAGLALLDELANALGAGADPKRLPMRIYVSRDDARLRRVRNEKELLPWFAALGFYRVVLKGMPIERQVALFRNAEAVAAPHGAGLAHIAWCQAGAKIVEFFPDPSGPRGRPKNATSDYWLIAQQRGLDYHAAFGGPSRDRADGFEIPKMTLTCALQEAGVR